jgi:dihydroorotase
LGFIKGKISVEKIVENVSNPAKIFKIEKQGFIRRNVLIWLSMNSDLLAWGVKRGEKENILAKCGWSPFSTLNQNPHTFVNGRLVYTLLK